MNDIIKKLAQQNANVRAKIYRFRNGNPTEEDIRQQKEMKKLSTDGIKQGNFCPHSDKGFQPSYCNGIGCIYKSICKTYLKNH